MGVYRIKYRADKTFRQILNAYQSGKRILFKFETSYQEENYQENKENYSILNKIYSTIYNNETFYTIRVEEANIYCTSLDDYPSNIGGS